MSGGGRWYEQYDATIRHVWTAQRQRDVLDWLEVERICTQAPVGVTDQYERARWAIDRAGRTDEMPNVPVGGRSRLLVPRFEIGVESYLVGGRSP